MRTRVVAYYGTFRVEVMIDGERWVSLDPTAYTTKDEAISVAAGLARSDEVVWESK